MENKIKNSCDGSRGCRVYIIPLDTKIKLINSKLNVKKIWK